MKLYKFIIIKLNKLNKNIFFIYTRTRSLAPLKTRWHLEASVSEWKHVANISISYGIDWLTHQSKFRASSEIHSHTRFYLKYKKFYFALKHLMNYFLGPLNIGGPWLQPTQPPPPLIYHCVRAVFILYCLIIFHFIGYWTFDSFKLRSKCVCWVQWLYM